MFSFLTQLLDTSGFRARWHCGNWTPSHGWLHIASDTAIFGAYLAIPLVLAYFVVRRRRDIPFPRIFWLFILFIAACGTTHLIEAIIFWHPVYRLAGVVKLVTAAVSWLTVLALIPLVPRALALRSPRELEREIAERKRSQEALSDKNLQLLEAERVRKEFFANVSHELRTPLTLILAPLESLLADESSGQDAAVGATLRTVHNNAVRLLQMVTGLLDYSRLEAGKLESDPQAVDVAALVEAALGDFRPAAGERRIELVYETSEPSIVVQIDRYLYERILFNLLSNAVKFTPAGGRITVRLRREQERLRLEVEDTGIGIPPEQQQSLFERFRQLDGAATRRYEGVGLGLALVKEFAELLGGYVAVRSELNRGSTFLVVCDAPPSSQEPAPTVERATRLVPHAAQRGPLGDDESSAPAIAGDANSAAELDNREVEATILVAEDNAEMAEYLRSLLARRYRVLIARDGEEALELIRQSPPDLLLADVMMPQRDGFSLCEEVKRHEQTAGVPVVLLTALTHREALLKGWRVGADEYLFKPFHPLELLARVASLLAAARDRRRAEQASRAARETLEEQVRERTAELQQANAVLRREAEQRRRGDEAAVRLAAIIEQSDDAITTKTLDATITSWNAGAERMYGYTAQEALGLPMTIVVPPDRRSEHDAIMRRIARGERVKHFETLRVRKDGRLIHVSLSISPLADETGAVIGASTIGRDITEEKHGEQLYRANQERLQFTLTAARVGTWDWNIESGEVAWSDNLEEIHGREPGTFGGTMESAVADVHPEDCEQVQRAVRRSLEQDGQRYDVEYRIVRHDGEIAWLQGKGQVIRDRHGRPLRMSGICMDVTDRKRAEETLIKLKDTLEERVASRTAELRLLNRVATAANAAVSVDAALQVGMEEVCNYTDWPVGHAYLYDDARGELTSLDLWCSAERGRYRAFREATMETTMCVDDVVVGQAFHQAAPVWLNNVVENTHFQRSRAAQQAGLRTAMAFPVLVGDAAAAVLEFYSPEDTEPDAALLDVMRQVGTQLGRVVERFQSRRLEEKMRHAQKLESLGVLAGGIAHDFNNLLTAVLGYTELALRKTPADSPLRELLGQVRSAALQAAELCNQMLAYSGKGKFVVEPIELSKLVREMTNLLSVSTSKKALVEFDFADDLPLVQGDPAQLRQVVMNLMTNASDALGDQSGEINIRTGIARLRGLQPSDVFAVENLPAGEYVFLEVADTGCGMDDDTRSRMFDPFFTTKFTGRGLGMAAVLGIVRGHGGMIRVQSEPGGGTVVRVFLPASNAAPKEPAGGAETAATEFARRRHILLVDDDPAVLRVTTLLLESFGFLVSQADNGQQAVEAVRRQADAFALVILDMTMPEMSGHEALDAIRAIRRDMPVLLTSGYREQDAAERMHGERPSAFIQKPFEFDALLLRVKQVLDEAER